MKRKLLTTLLALLLALSTIGLFACGSGGAKKDCTVSFDCNFTDIPSQTVKKGKKATQPVIEGFEIEGYYYNNQKWSFENNEITEDITITVNTTEPKGLTLEEDDANNYIIKKYKGVESDLIIPSFIDGKPVVKVALNAFYECKSLKSLILPNSVTTIAPTAFGFCTNLENLVIGSQLTYVGGDAFYKCDSLKFNEHNNAKYLGNSQNEFIVLVKAKDKKITECEIPSTTKFICDFAFSDCTLLQNVTIPEGVTTIWRSAFSGCSSLKSVEIPDSVTNLDIEVFRDCKKVESITIGKGVTYLPAQIFINCESVESVTIPNNIKTIEAGAFSGCKKLQQVIIPDSVTSLGASAFSNCESLKNISLPSSVTSIGSRAFYSCDNLQSIEIPQGVTSIEEYTFMGCYKLGELTIPVSVTSIGKSAITLSDAGGSIIFKGTAAQWKAIEKDNWYSGLPRYSIVCSDQLID